MLTRINYQMLVLTNFDSTVAAAVVLVNVLPGGGTVQTQVVQ